jgi:hypothetical protein
MHTNKGGYDMYRTTIAAAILLGACGSALGDTDMQSTYWFADGTDANGYSFLTRTHDRIIVTMELAGLNPGDAFTLWWVVFNTPEGCVDGCGEDEFGSDESLVAAGLAVANATGNIVKSDGTMEFGAVLQRGQDDPSHQVLFSTVGPVLAADPDDAEVHLIVQSHGQARGGKKLREQVSMFEANCTPACADLQFAVHLSAP